MSVTLKSRLSKKGVENIFIILYIFTLCTGTSTSTLTWKTLRTCTRTQFLPTFYVFSEKRKRNEMKRDETSITKSHKYI